jgi:hypothetical protein
MVQQKLVNEGKIEVVENPRFMTEARRREPERGVDAGGQGREEETFVVSSSSP